MKKIISIIMIAVILLLIIINVFSLFNLSIMGFRNFKVSSGSMDPNLKINDIIIVKKNNNYKINDIITYKKDDEYITHRIVSIKDNVIITKGDANNINDEPLTKDIVIGKVVYKYKYIGFIFYLFSKPIFLILTFIIGIIITILIPDKKKGA